MRGWLPAVIRPSITSERRLNMESARPGQGRDAGGQGGGATNIGDANRYRPNRSEEDDPGKLFTDAVEVIL